MKKIVCCMIVLLTVLQLISCGFDTNTTYVVGLENINCGHYDDVELRKYLLPSEDYMTKFEYVQGDYFYWGKIFSLNKAFVYFEYTPENYEEALEYAQNNMSFLEGNSHEFNGYKFIQQDMSLHYSSVPKFPDWFWMMFYSKERNIIGFLAYSNIPMEQEVPADEDFEGFIRYEFSNYDWDTQTIKCEIAYLLDNKLQGEVKTQTQTKPSGIHNRKY